MPLLSYVLPPLSKNTGYVAVTIKQMFLKADVSNRISAFGQFAWKPFINFLNFKFQIPVSIYRLLLIKEQIIKVGFILKFSYLYIIL